MDESVSFPLPITVSLPDASTIVEATNTTDTDALWDQFNKFYSKNEAAIEKCKKTDVRSLALGDKVSDIELKIDTFSETTKVVLDGLAGLGKIHPIIGTAVVAFHAVISLDLSRRDNDRKVIAIMVEMQNMMCAMFQLRQLKHTNVQESERDTEKSRLRQLIESITADIIKCGSDLNYYLSQKFAFKLIKAKNFEQRFKAHVENFALRRSELQSTITVYIAGGIDQANVTITAVSTKLDAVDAKLDYFFHAFLRKLDTPQEKEAFRFFEQNNGVENCISKDELLGRLLSMTGDVLPDSESKAGLKPDERIKKSRKMLTDEVQLNFEEALKQNTLRFERLLAIQNNNNERVIAQLEKQEGYHEVTVSKLDKLLSYMHSDNKLNDPEVRRIWERMGLKTSVKAKNFVLTFRDHYQQDHSVPPTPNHVVNVSPPLFVDDTNGAQSLSLSTNFHQTNPSSPPEDPNAWLLEYIDVAHVRPIVEAMDADVSGFISVKEINTFARARPKEWSLLQWMVYWAAGWYTNINQYRDKIYDILIQMYESLPSLHPANRVFADEYLHGSSMDIIESILRCTKGVTDGQQIQLTELAQFYADTQESALRTNLKEVSYVISSVADATLVAGPARAESWIYPLLCLLLERHLAVLKLGRTQVYDEFEMSTHSLSLESVLAVFKQRKDALTAIFSQIYQNVAGRFETFAYGMFYPLYKEDTEITPAKNTLIKVRTKRPIGELLLEMRNKREEPAVPFDTAILALEKGSPFEFEDLDIYKSANVKLNPSDPISHPLEGYWSVTCIGSDGSHFPDLGLFHFALSVASDGLITGSGEAYVGKLHLTGTTVLSGERSATHSVELKMVVDNSETDYLFRGEHNVERDVVTGSWKTVNRSEETPSEASTEEAADTAQEGTSNDTVQDVKAGQGILTLSNGTTDPVDANTTSEQEMHASTVVEDAQTLNTPHGILDGKKQADPTDTDTCSDAGTTEEDNQAQETTDKAEGSNNMTPEDDSDSGISEPVLDRSAAGNVAEGTEGAGVTDVEEEESTLSLKTFSMRRTPADLHRFRSDLNLDTETDLSVLARNRWKFAIEATKFQVQIKNFSWSYVRARFAERRLWLDLTVAFWRGLLPQNRIDLMCALTGVYPPSQSRLYEDIANYLDPRGYAYKIGRNLTCDYCGYAIVCGRYNCITCIDEDLSNQIYLCTDTPECIENEFSNTVHDFVHSPSHTLLRSKFWWHKIFFRQIPPLTRTRSEDFKKRFRMLEEKKKMSKKAKSSKSGKSGHGSQMEELANVQPLYCVCCKKEVSLPCWICAGCDMDTAVCLDCELKQAEIVTYDNRDTMHSHSHLLLRISDSVEVRSREVNNVRLQRELTNITSDLRSLEQKVTTHLRAASKVNTVLRRFTVDGDIIRITAEDNANNEPAATGEAAMTTAATQDAASEEEDDMSDLFGSTYSSDAESEVLAPSAPDTRPAAGTQSLPANTSADPSEHTESATSSPPEMESVTAPDLVQHNAAALVLPEAPMITPTPTTAKFFASFAAEPAHSESLHDTGDLTSDNNKHALALHEQAVEQGPKAGPVAPRAAATAPLKAQQFADHLVSTIDTRISFLDTRISSLDTRISSLDGRLSGVEGQLGEILSLLRQSRPT